MSARMQFCGRFPGLRAVSGIWSGAAADSLSLGSKRSGCVGLQSTQPKHRRFETVRLSASRPSAGRSTQSPGTSAKLLHGRTRGAVSGGWKVKGVKVKIKVKIEVKIKVKGVKVKGRICGIVCRTVRRFVGAVVCACRTARRSCGAVACAWRTVGCSCGAVVCVCRVARRSCGAVACVV
mgnify:FL=1